MYDAAVAQVIYHYNNEQLGGFSGTVVKMLEADPHFAMGNILQLVLDSFGKNFHVSRIFISVHTTLQTATSPDKNQAPRKKLFDLSARYTSSSSSVRLTNQETAHLRAAVALADEDYVVAMAEYEEILREAPLDMFALHMGYFLALTTGHTSKLRDLPAGVVSQYKPGMPYYG